MAYTRWSNSTWYTFWGATKDKEKGNQTLVIMYDMVHNFSFIYDQIKENIDKCLRIVAKHTGEKPDKIEELKTVMLNFLEDVDQEYKKDK